MVEFSKFEEYKLFVEDTARFTERRQTISNIYIAVNTLLLAAIGLFIKDLGTLGSWILILCVPLVAAGVFVSLWWRQLIIKYKDFAFPDVEKEIKCQNPFIHYPLRELPLESELRGINFLEFLPESKEVDVRVRDEQIANELSQLPEEPIF